MANRIGQKRNADFGNSFANCLDATTTFSTTIESNNIFGDTSDYQYNQHYFYDCGFLTPTFSMSDVYYLTLKLKKKEQEISFNIKLQNEDNFSWQTQTLKLCTLNAKVNDGEYNIFDTVFTPNMSSYNRVVFCINRQAVDIIGKPNQTEPVTPRTLIDNRQDCEYHLYSLNNLINSGEGAWKKMGIQTRPGSLITINKEPIRIGRSGIYELNNGSKIEDFRIASGLGKFNNGEENASTEADPFLVDYVYTEREENS